MSFGFGLSFNYASRGYRPAFFGCGYPVVFYNPYAFFNFYYSYGYPNWYNPCWYPPISWGGCYGNSYGCNRYWC